MKKRKKDTWGDAVGNAPWAAELAPADGDLRIIQALVNTADHRRGTDELTSPQALADWLGRWGLVPAGTKLGEAELERITQVRGDLRVLVGGNRGGAVDEATVERLDRAAADATLRVRFDGRGTTRIEPGTGGFEGALGRLFRVVALAQLRGLWPRLKLCANEACGRAFYDGSPNRSGKWCTMRRCGGAAKSLTWRRRNPESVY